MVGFFIYLCFLLGFPALAQTRFGAFGISSKVSHLSAGGRTNGTNTYGGGFLLERSKSGFKGWEYGFYYLQRSWSPDSGSSILIFPAQYNYWFSPIIGLGGGGYWGIGQGQIRLNGLTRSYAESFHSKYDYGLSASLKMNLPFQIPLGTSLLLELRYQSGFANLSMASTATRKYSDLIFMIGIRVGSLGYNPDENSKGGRSGRSR